MGHLRQRGNSWYYYWNTKVDGKRKQNCEILGEITKREAQEEKIRLDREKQLIKNGHKDEIKRITLESFFEKYKEHFQTVSSEGASRRLGIVIDHFNKFIGEALLPAITAEAVDTYITSRLKTVKPATVNTEIRYLKSAFNQARRWQYISRNPFEDVNQVREEKKTEEEAFLSLDQIKKLLEAVKGHALEPIVHFYLLTGTRLQEATSLMGDDIDFENRVITLRAAKTKTRTSRQVYFSEGSELHKLLLAQRPEPGMPVFQSSRFAGKPWSHYTVSRTMSLMFDDLGMPWASLHTLRHTFISHLANQGEALTTIASLAGHMDKRTTEKYYAHAKREMMEQAVEKLPYKVGK